MHKFFCVFLLCYQQCYGIPNGEAHHNSGFERSCFPYCSETHNHPPPCFPFCSSGPSSPHHHHHTTARTVYTTAPPPTRKPRPPRPASCARRTSTSRSAQKGLCIKIVTSIYNSEQIFPGLTATSESKAGRHMLLLALLENIDKPLTEPRCDISCFVT